MYFNFLNISYSSLFFHYFVSHPLKIYTLANMLSQPIQLLKDPATSGQPSSKPQHFSTHLPRNLRDQCHYNNISSRSVFHSIYLSSRVNASVEHSSVHSLSRVPIIRYHVFQSFVITCSTHSLSRVPLIRCHVFPSFVVTCYF